MLLAWTLLLCWLFIAPHAVSSAAVFLSSPLALLAAVAAVALPAVLIWRVEIRFGRPAAALALVLLLTAAVALLAAGAQVAGALAATALILAAAYGYGAAVASRLDPGDGANGWGAAPYCMTLGLAALVLLGVAAGTAGILNRTAFGTIVLVGIVLAGVQVRAIRGPAGKRPAPVWEQPGAMWWWGWGVLVLIGFVGALAPEVRHDALGAHLPIAREFAGRGAIVEMRQHIVSYFQMNGAVLYAWAMLVVPGEAAPKLLHFSAGVLVSLLTYDIGRRLWNPRVGLAASVVVLGTPLVWWVGGSAYTDLWAVLFAIGAVSALVSFTRQPSPGRAMLVGVMGGTAMGVKLTSLLLVGPAAAALAFFTLRSALSLRERTSIMAACVAGALLTGTFWYIRAWVLTGNPVLPLLNGVFQSPYWPVENTRLNMPTFGMGVGLRDLALLPWRLTFLPSRFVETGNIGIVYLALAPAALAATVRGQVPRWLVAVAGTAGLLWFLSAQYLRYLLPVLPLAAVMVTAGVFGRAAPAKAAFPAVLALVAALSVGTADWVASGAPNFPLAVALGTNARSAYAARYVDGFPLADYARGVLPPSARVYGVGEDMVFLYDRYFVPISWYGRIAHPAMPDLVLRARTGREVQAALTRAGFTHLVVKPGYPMIVRWRHRHGWIAREAFWEEAPRLVYAYRGSYLFQLDSPAGDLPREPGPNLLPYATASGRADTVTRIGAGEHIRQLIPVAAGRLYALEAAIRSASPGATARLFIQWLDGEGRVLDYTTWRQVTPGSEAKRYATACAAPLKAHSASIWLIAGPEADVEFSNARFYELR